MTHSAPGGDMLEGLDADPWERQQLDEVLDEVEQEKAAGFYDEEAGDVEPGDDLDGEDPDASWAALEDAGAALDRARELDALRLAEITGDAIGRPPRDEAKLARGIRRAEAGTLTPPSQLRPARDPDGQFAAICGDADDYGRCASQYHQAGCTAVIASAAANGSYEEAEQWNATLQGQPSALDVAEAEQQLGFANDPLDLSGDRAEPHDPLGVDFGDLLDDGQRLPYDELRDHLVHRLGLSDPPPPRQPRQPPVDVSGWRAALGI